MQGRTRLLQALGAFSLVAVAAGLASAQTASPSRLTPQSYRVDLAPVLPQGPASSEEPAQGGEGVDLSVFVSGIDIDGGFAAPMRAAADLIATKRNTRLTVSQIFAIAREVEALYAEAGYLLVRVTIPPQVLTDGGRLKLLVVDGVVGAIRTEGVPASQRGVVLDRLAGIKGRSRLRQDQIERPLLLAGEVPGLELSSALEPGAEVGETTLILDGRHEPVSVVLSVLNDLPASVGRWKQSLWASVNSPFGRGEQGYLSFSSSVEEGPLPDEDRGFLSFALGAVVPLGANGLGLNPEYSFSRIVYPAGGGLPSTISTYRRLALRADYPIHLTRARNWTAGLSLEHQVQEDVAAGFGTAISLDDYWVIRLSSRHRVRTGHTNLDLGVTQSFGLSGRAGGVVPVSRAGAEADFAKLTADLHLSGALSDALGFDLYGAAQTGFGDPLFRSEQFALDGPRALAGFEPGALSVDAGATIRLELARPWQTGPESGGLGIETFLSAAAGWGKLENPSVVEQGEVWARSASVGLRTVFPGEGDAMRLDGKIEIGVGTSTASAASSVRLLGSVEVRF
jgi:hemolysin activation/secretion protein